MLKYLPNKTKVYAKELYLAVIFSFQAGVEVRRLLYMSLEVTSPFGTIKGVEINVNTVPFTKQGATYQ